MSLTLCVTTPEGIVLSADSRQTYQNVVGAKRIGSDSATKIFSVNNKIGITVAGPAFLVDPNDKNGEAKGIGSFIKELILKEDKKITVSSIAKILYDGLEKIYNPKTLLAKMESEIEVKLKQMGAKVIKKQVKNNGQAIVVDFIDGNGKPQNAVGQIMSIDIMIAGYDYSEKGIPELNLYKVSIPGEIINSRTQGAKNQFGASWTGQTDVVHRTILGFDPRIGSTATVQAAAKNLGEDKVKEDLRTLEYIINWGAMTLFDAVDFAKLMVETTSAIQRFSDGIKLLPGDMPGVGGPVDVAIITPQEGFRWHQKKELNLIDNCRSK